MSSIPREDHVGDHGDEIVEEGDDQADDGDQSDDWRGEPINHQEDDRHDASCEARVPILSRRVNIGCDTTYWLLTCLLPGDDGVEDDSNAL